MIFEQRNLNLICFFLFYFVYIICLPLLLFDFFLIVWNHELVVRALKKGLMLQFLCIRPVLLLCCLDISLFGLHYAFTWLWSDDDDDEHYDTIRKCHRFLWGTGTGR